MHRLNLQAVMLPQVLNKVTLCWMGKKKICLIVSGCMNMVECMLSFPIAQALLPEWHQFSLHTQLYRALHSQGFTAPTPIQSRAIPSASKGKDVVGVAQTVCGHNCSLPSDKRSPDTDNRAQVKRLRTVCLY